MIKFLFASAVTIAPALIAGLAPLPALAKDHSWPVGNDQFHVYYRDLNMNRSADRAEMLARVESAAAKLCGARASLKVDIDACVADVVGQAMPRSPILRLALSERTTAKLATR